jgi:hypothetical protein
MRLILAAILAMGVCGQAWAWDDEGDERIFGNGRYRTMAEWQEAEEAKRQLESDRRQREFNDNEMLYNQERSLRMQEESLKIQKKRLELDEERTRRDGWR